jgi:DnaK suppressor protein
MGDTRARHDQIRPVGKKCLTQATGIHAGAPTCTVPRHWPDSRACSTTGARLPAPGMPTDAGRFSLVMTERFPDASSLEEQLTAERASTLERIAALTRDWDGIVESSTDIGVDDEHDPEGATIAFERSQIESLLDQSRRHLSDLDRALRQLHEGDYGTCERCGRPIAADRLAARPSASTCIACATAR